MKTELLPDVDFTQFDHHNDEEEDVVDVASEDDSELKWEWSFKSEEKWQLYVIRRAFLFPVTFKNPLISRFCVYFCGHKKSPWRDVI